jgi:hypothetical protein
MKKKKYLGTSLCLMATLFSFPLWAEGLPEGEYLDEPPPTAPIDGPLIWLSLISFVFVAYFFYKKHQTVLNASK